MNKKVRKPRPLKSFRIDAEIETNGNIFIEGFREQPRHAIKEMKRLRVWLDKAIKYVESELL